MDISKFIDAFPFISIHADSSFRESQQMSGPKIAPKGKKNPDKADR